MSEGYGEGGEGGEGGGEGGGGGGGRKSGSGGGGGVEGRDITEGCNCKCRHISNKCMHQPEILHCVTDCNVEGNLF